MLDIHVKYNEKNTNFMSCHEKLYEKYNLMINKNVIEIRNVMVVFAFVVIVFY